MEIVLDSLLDSLKLLPFLFFTYLLMEWLEHRAGDGMKRFVMRSGRFGPLFGSVLGLIPQCGFASAAAGFYAGRLITPGTLLAVFLATSDEMLPIMLSSGMAVPLMLKILSYKLVIGLSAGLLLDLLLPKQARVGLDGVCPLCEEENCGCEESILKAAIHHTVHIWIFIFLISVLIAAGVAVSGLENLAAFALNRPVTGELLGALIGLIPNCVTSVIITKFWIEGVMSTGAMMAGLLSNAGAGLLVLLHIRRGWKGKLSFLALLYAVAVVGGLLIELLNISF